MSEHDEQAPMTRRERRLRELAETGALDLSEALQMAREPLPSQEDSELQASGESGDVDSALSASDIEISPLNEDGTPRSRREMRQLREEALAALEAEATPAGEDAAVLDADEAVDADQSEPVAEELVEVEEPLATEEPVAVEETVIAEETVASQEAADPKTEDVIIDGLVESAKASAEDAPSEAPDFDSLMAPPTEPFSVAEIRDAESAGPNASEEPAVEGAAEEVIELVVDQAEPVDAEPIAAAEPEKPKRRFPWKRNKTQAEPVADETDVEAEVAEAEEAVPGEVSDNAGASNEEAVEPDASAVVEETEAEAEAEAETSESLPAPKSAASQRRAPAVVPEASVAGDENEADVNASQKYSFPDIVPPEEWRSVFDDPASRTVGDRGSNANNGDFDDLISRAVAQEGATGISNTSALILPTMPDDTGGLTGPLGATGELYITGSIELPRSLGETGGHSSLHDSVQLDPVVVPDEAEASAFAEAGPTPVAAKHAVSARASSGMNLVAKPSKEQSKLPLILTLSGGGLLVVVVGLGVWGATNGMFSG